LDFGLWPGADAVAKFTGAWKSVVLDATVEGVPRFDDAAGLKLSET
jgi:hypothetical protein